MRIFGIEVTPFSEWGVQAVNHKGKTLVAIFDGQSRIAIGVAEGCQHQFGNFETLSLTETGLLTGVEMRAKSKIVPKGMTFEEVYEVREKAEIRLQLTPARNLGERGMGFKGNSLECRGFRDSF